MRVDMRLKVTIKRRETTPNSYGEELTWVPLRTVWASMEPLLGKEFFDGVAMGTKAGVKFRCHYFEGPADEMRVYTADGTAYDIVSAVNVKAYHREWLLYCTKVVR